MVQISQINLNGTIYELKDKEAEAQLANLANLESGVKTINGLSGDVVLSLTKDANNEYSLSAINNDDAPVDPESTFDSLSRKIQNGTLSAEYSIGDIITCNHSEFGELAWQIVDFDSEELVDTSIQHSVTLCLSGCLPGTFEYDTKSSLEDQSDDESMRYNYYSRWKYTTSRQWLNTSGNANTWWSQLVSGDVAPTYANRNGFLRGLENDFFNHIADVKLKSNAYSYENYSTDPDNGNSGEGVVDETIDKIFVPSLKNLIESQQNWNYYNEPNTNTWDYFSQNYENLIKYDENESPINYPTRTHVDSFESPVLAYCGVNLLYGVDISEAANFVEESDGLSLNNLVICCVLI